MAAATFRARLPGRRARQRAPVRRCLDHAVADHPDAARHLRERQARGRSRTDAALCFAGTLDPTKATGKVVVCNRGVNARIDKGFEVQRAGGVGMVMANTTPELAQR